MVWPSVEVVRLWTVNMCLSFHRVSYISIYKLTYIHLFIYIQYECTLV